MRKVKDKDKVIQIATFKNGTLTALTNRGRIFCQSVEQVKDENGYVVRWFEIKNPLSECSSPPTPKEEK